MCYSHNSVRLCLMSTADLLAVLLRLPKTQVGWRSKLHRDCIREEALIEVGALEAEVEELGAVRV